ncbi:MAG TPA: hypothetical protein VIT18_09115 [Terrimicrobiaceae bacterium]
MTTTLERFEVHSYWGGGPLTQLELVCLSSFVQNGAHYNLYTYDEPAGVPDGITLRDASEILPADRMFLYPAGTLNEGSLSGFSNLFRYTLLQRTGGWWVDTDVCCLRPFDQDRDELYLREETQSGEFFVASCIFRVPSASAVLQRCLEAFSHKDVTKVVHGETGPALLTDAVRQSGREDAVQPGDQFFPVPWWDYERLFFDEQLSIDHCCAVHFWNTMLRTAGVDKNADFPANSAFERLKRRYLS